MIAATLEVDADLVRIQLEEYVHEQLESMGDPELILEGFNSGEARR